MHDISEFVHPFILNAALILLVAAVFAPIDARLGNTRRGVAATGVLFGIMAIGCMSAPLVSAPGLFFDLRYTPLVVAGALGGPLGAAIAAVAASAYRLWVGGFGAPAGVIGILAAAALGIGMYYLPGRFDTWRKAALAGGLVPVVTLPSLFAALPFDDALAMIGTLAIPFFVAYPITTVMVCHLISRDRRHREAETALTASEGRFRQIVKVATDWFWETDSELRFTYFSPGAAPDATVRKLLGRRRDELALDPDSRDLHRHMDDMRNRRVFRDFRHALKPIEGWPRYVSVSGAPFYDDDGRFVGYVGSGRDITAEMEKEAALKQARQEAISANEAKSAFLANVSHEIRTPMTGMLGMLDMLEITRLSDEQRQYVGTVRSSADALLTIVNDVLDLSKIEAGSMRIDSAPFDLRAMLATACAGPEAAARAKGLDFTWQVDPKLGETAVGDRHRIAQVIANFLSNAVRFTNEGGIRVEARPDGGNVAFSVSDTGVGVPAHKVEQIFRPFEQADASTTRQFGGTGLGLAICRRLADALGGTVSVTSTQNEGSTFTLALPLTFTTEEQGAPSDATISATPVAHVPARLLVAEDNEINALLLRTMLTRRGYHVTMVENGEKAVAAVEAGTFDAALLDMHMPVMDGTEATRRIRALPKPKGDMPVFALTADALHQNRNRYQGIGLTAFLTKPIDWDALDRAIATHVPDRFDGDPETPMPEPDARAPGDRDGDKASVDVATANERTGGDDVPLIDRQHQDIIMRTTGSAVFRELVEVFVPAMESDLERLRACVAEADAAQQKEVLHSLRGQAANLGASRLAAAARACESALPGAPVTAEQLSRIEALARDTNDALRADSLAA